MTAVARALAALDTQMRGLDELRKALDAGDLLRAQRAQRAHAAVPAWSLPASVGAALTELRETSTVTTDPPPSRDYVGPGWADGEVGRD